MCILSIHMIRQDNYLQYITMKRFTVIKTSEKSSYLFLLLIYWKENNAYKSLPSSVSSADTSYVIQPFGLSKGMTLTS